MTSREARTRRRAEERKIKKLEYKASRSASQLPVAHFNPELEDEFPRELQIEANVMRESAKGAAARDQAGEAFPSSSGGALDAVPVLREFFNIHRKVGLQPLDGFVLQSDAKPSAAPAPGKHGFVSQPVPASSKRAEINRANAIRSTGPKSAEGKLASSGNSLKHGLASGKVIIPGEDATAFDALLGELLEEHQPATPTEELLINEMAQSYWLTQRALRFQNECFTENGVDEKRLSLFLRYQTTHDRAFHKALATLLKLQSRERQRPVTVPGFVWQNNPAAPPTQAINTQFVRQNSPNLTAEPAA